jgi:hypothetical protein
VQKVHHGVHLHTHRRAAIDARHNSVTPQNHRTSTPKEMKIFCVSFYVCNAYSLTVDDAKGEGCYLEADPEPQPRGRERLFTKVAVNKPSAIAHYFLNLPRLQGTASSHASVFTGSGHLVINHKMTSCRQWLGEHIRGADDGTVAREQEMTSATSVHAGSTSTPPHSPSAAAVSHAVQSCCQGQSRVLSSYTAK